MKNVFKQPYNPVKRKLIQIAAFGFSNARLGNFAKGELYTGSWKNFCQPGMNCYSCPAAQFACPIGAMQAVAGDPAHRFSFYVVGLLLAFGVIFGRAICGFFCPFGLLQELLYKIPLRRLFLKKNGDKKITLPKWMTYIKYVVLLLFVLILPNVLVNVMGMGQPAFCEYICPVGTLEGGIPLLATHPELRAILGSLFGLKMAIFILVLGGCMVVYRFFCKTLCPLGAWYGILNKISLYTLKVDEHRCINCGFCSQVCLMDVDPVKCPNSAECIRCGACAHVCPKQAIHLGFEKNGYRYLSPVSNREN